MHAICQPKVLANIICFLNRFTRQDEYTLDFLELGEELSERELQRSLITRIEDFLRSMGGMFAFMGSKYRLEVEGKEFFIDLVLFHRRLRCLVATKTLTLVSRFV